MARSAPETAEEFVVRYLRAQGRFVDRNSYGYKVRRQSVLAISVTREETVVTTSGMGPRKRRRYHVRKQGQQWDLAGIELECSVCSGSGRVSPQESCGLCAGGGWTVA